MTALTRTRSSNEMWMHEYKKVHTAKGCVTPVAGSGAQTVLEHPDVDTFAVACCAAEDLLKLEQQLVHLPGLHQAVQYLHGATQCPKVRAADGDCMIRNPVPCQHRCTRQG